jgi:hypothetical protein
LLLFCYVRKDFTDPYVCVRDYNNSFSGRGRNSNGGYIFAITIYSNGTGLPAAMIVGTLVDPMATLLNANGDVVSAMLITRISEGKKMALNTLTT